jgi:hypothetical protein
MREKLAGVKELGGGKSGPEFRLPRHFAGGMHLVFAIN